MALSGLRTNWLHGNDYADRDALTRDFESGQTGTITQGLPHLHFSFIGGKAQLVCQQDGNASAVRLLWYNGHRPRHGDFEHLSRSDVSTTANVRLGRPALDACVHVRYQNTDAQEVAPD
ncbi:MAG: hypothetical protein ABI369_13100 [Acetobacteraceae bacterium]